MFYELMLPYIKLRLPEFKFEDIYSILLSASRPLVKKRAVCRELIDLGLSGMPLMKNNLEKLPQENFEKMSFQYYRVLINFVFKKEQKVLIEKSFTTMNIDITKICARYGYLIPQSKEIELIEDDVNENDEENDTKIEENNK